MHTPLCSPTDQGTCAGLSRRGTAPSCVSGSMNKFEIHLGRVTTGPTGKHAAFWPIQRFLSKTSKCLPAFGGGDSVPPAVAILPFSDVGSGSGSGSADFVSS
eukprot:1512298-Prymnesium_polylepis.1